MPNTLAESGMAIPEEPVLFFKASSAICGPFDEVIIPKGGDKTDWEVELAVVIGKKSLLTLMSLMLCNT